MSCSRSAINAVNRRFRVRQYEGRRRRWMVAAPGPTDPRNAASTPIQVG
ncbi:MAG TPA: hypothetical protein VFY29_05560 [Terriglobia bacterium]|nr:hypothetical protein [Terriglobia bacterium]